ncbi:LuxR C-terminal-related transcriptional regulator [Streptomyces sp. NPDC002521]
MEPLRVSILGRDPLADEGIASYLRNSPVMRVLPSAARGTSDVCVVIDNDVNAATWRRVEYAAKQAANPALRMVLIADAVPAHQLQRARRWGVVSVLPRSTAVREQVLAAVFAARIRGLQRQAGSTLAHLVQPAPRQDSAPRTALTTREIHVVRLLADGLSTAEVAQQLNFSERTIRNTISALLNRLHLRNRTHAVAYALRQGVL